MLRTGVETLPCDTRSWTSLKVSKDPELEISLTNSHGPLGWPNVDTCFAIPLAVEKTNLNRFDARPIPDYCLHGWAVILSD